MKFLRGITWFSFILLSCQNRNTITETANSDSSISSQESNIIVNPQRNDTLKVNQSSTSLHATLDSLQGVWISDDDTGDHVIIHSNNYFEANSGDTLKSLFYLTDTCITDQKLLNHKMQSGKYIMAFDIGSSTDSYCYRINQLSEENLELDYINNDKMLNFHKKK